MHFTWTPFKVHVVLYMPFEGMFIWIRKHYVTSNCRIVKEYNTSPIIACLLFNSTVVYSPLLFLLSCIYTCIAYNLFIHVHVHTVCIVIVFSRYIVKKLYSYFRPAVILSLYVTSSDSVCSLRWLYL